MLLKLSLYNICVQKKTSRFLPLLSCLLTVPVSSIFRYRRFTVCCEWPMFAGELCCSNLIIPCLFYCCSIFVNMLPSLDNVLQTVYTFLFFCKQTLTSHRRNRKSVSLSTLRNLDDDRLNFRSFKK